MRSDHAGVAVGWSAHRWLPMCGLLLGLSTVFLFVGERDFLYGHHTHDGTTATNMTLAQNLSAQHPFGFLNMRRRSNGTVRYEMYNRFPIGTVVLIKLAMLPFGEFSAQLVAARALMLAFFCAAAVLAYLALARLVASRAIALAATLFAFSSYHLLHYSDAVSNQMSVGPVRRDAGLPRHGVVHERRGENVALAVGVASGRGAAAGVARLWAAVAVPRLGSGSRGGCGVARRRDEDVRRAPAGCRRARPAQSPRAARRTGAAVRRWCARLQLRSGTRGGRRSAGGGGAAIGPIDVEAHRAAGDDLQQRRRAGVADLPEVAVPPGRRVVRAVRAVRRRRVARRRVAGVRRDAFVLDGRDRHRRLFRRSRAVSAVRGRRRRPWRSPASAGRFWFPTTWLGPITNSRPCSTLAFRCACSPPCWSERSGSGGGRWPRSARSPRWGCLRLRAFPWACCA